MNVTFLIGNGFDKQLGLNTGYDEFIEWYIQQKSTNSTIAGFKEFLKKEKQNKKGKYSWWSNAELAMGEHLGRFPKDIVDLYYEQIRDFKINLGEYLRQQEARCDFSDVDKIAATFNSFLLNYHTEIMLNKIRGQFSSNRDISYHFINFNYTRTLDEIISCSKSRGLIYQRTLGKTIYRGEIGKNIHIHGQLDSAIIMGVNDRSQLNIADETVSSKLLRTMIKPRVNSAMGRIEDEEATELILSSGIIAIYGLSLGDTDKKWRDLIGENLRNVNNCVVLFGHKKAESINPLIPEDQLDYVAAIQENFLKKIYPDISEEILEVHRDQVFIIDKTTYLDFEIVDQKQSEHEPVMV